MLAAGQNHLEEVCVLKARLKFTKAGSMKFIGHLDIMRYFQKALRRSEVQVSYSQGFSPHQLISFAAPLGVGLTSDGEYMDMQLESSLSSKEMIEKINGVMNEELRIVRFVELKEDSKNAMSIVAAADYMVSLKDGYNMIENFQEKFLCFLNQENIIVTKKTKKSEREMDIKPYIYEAAFTKEDFARKIKRELGDTVADVYENGVKVYLQITTGSVVNIKPELIMEAFCKYVNIDFEPFAYQIHRMEVYADLNADPKQSEEHYGQNKRLVPLEQFGSTIE